MWSDYGDEIISSRQKYSTKEICQIDALRHTPSFRESELLGRTGKPKLAVTAEPVLQYRWVISVYDKERVEIVKQTEDRWYKSVAECLYAADQVNIELDESFFQYDVAFESRTVAAKKLSCVSCHSKSSTQ